MKHVCRIVAACLIAVMSLSLLTACGVPTENEETTTSVSEDYTTTADRFSETPEELLGTYKGSYIYQENSFDSVIVLKADGTYTMDIKKNGEPSSSKTGEYGAAGSLVRLYLTSDYGTYIEYLYEAGTLRNNNHTFNKVS